MASCAYRVKIVIIGESSVGKTSLLNYFVTEKRPDPGTLTTIGVDFKSRRIDRTVNGDTQQVNVLVWDTAGQERFRTITPQMYRNTAGADGKPTPMGIIVCYDITTKETFENVEYWVSEYRQHSSGNVVSCLAGNKIDLAEKRQVQREAGEELAQRLNMNYFYETSAYTGEHLEEMFLKVVDEVLLGMIRMEEGIEAPTLGPIAGGESIVIDSSQERVRKRDKCKC